MEEVCAVQIIDLVLVSIYCSDLSFSGVPLFLGALKFGGLVVKFIACFPHAVCLSLEEHEEFDRPCFHVFRRVGGLFLVVFALSGLEGGGEKSPEYHAPANSCLWVIIQV